LYDETLDSYATTATTSESNDGSIQEPQHDHRNNLCHTCHIVKPPRSKHDRYTHACVLLFDHHCPFVGNTVGLLNYKWFYLFLVSMTIYCALMLILLTIYCRRQPRLPLTTLLIGLFLGLHGLVSAGMWIYHTQLTAMNLSTNEHINLQRYDYFWTRRPEGGRRFHNPWNKGWLANFVDRWNPSDACFLLPQHRRPQQSSTLEMQTLLGSLEHSDV
jgi:palmitoyltransferase ZDHHC13/17